MNSPENFKWLPHLKVKSRYPGRGIGNRCCQRPVILKEMLPLVDKSLIQYVVNECIAAGITEIVLVTHSSKTLLKTTFDTSFELEAMLKTR